MTITLEPATLRQTTTDLGTHTVPDLQSEPDEGLWVSKIAPTGRPEPWQLVQGKPELRRRLTNVAQHGVALLAGRASGPLRSAQIARVKPGLLTLEIAEGKDQLYWQVVRVGDSTTSWLPRRVPGLTREGTAGPRPVWVWTGEQCDIPSTDLALELLWSFCKHGALRDGWTVTARPDYRKESAL